MEHFSLQLFVREIFQLPMELNQDDQVDDANQDVTAYLDPRKRDLVTILVVAPIG